MAQLVSNRTGVDEKGQRSVRSLDVYLPKRGLPEGALCKGCGIVYHNKRWQPENTQEGSNCQVLCPACQRTQDHNPAGVITLSGPYLVSHKDEILNTIKQQETKSREKNPIGRIMEIKEEGNRITVTTTEDKLAQKLGREVYKSQKGELHYQWSHDQRMVRVDWMR
jgi:NMD protein affecting ribosome stability and mRNA decay